MAQVSYVLCLFLLVFAPLAFGTVEQWSLAIVELVVSLAAGLVLLRQFLDGKGPRRIIGLWPLLLLCGFVGFQLIPLPPVIQQWLGAGHAAVYQPVVQTFSEVPWVPISVDPKATLHELLRLLAGVGFYVLTVQHLSSPEKLKKAVRVVLAVAGCVALLGILQKVSSPDKIFWFRAVPANAHPFGPWVNANQFAGFVELMLPLMFALFLYNRPTVKEERGWRERVVSFFTTPTLHLHLFFGAGVVVMLLAMALSLSRGGILSLIVAGFTFFFLYNQKFPRRGRHLLFGMLLVLLIVFAWAGWDTIIREFNQAFDESGRLSDGRLTIWRDCLNIVRDFPLVGAGFGSFMALYPSYKTVSDSLIYDHAHNDYIELLTDGGIVAFFLVSWFMVLLLRHGWKMVRARRDNYAVLVGIGGLSGIVAILAHSVTDFNLHNGAVGIYFFFVCGVLVSAVNCRFSYFDSGSLLRRASRSLAGGLCLLFLFVSIGGSLVQVGTFSANYLYRQVADIYINRHLAPEKVEEVANRMTLALRRDPLEGLYPFKLGQVRWSQDEKEQARSLYRQAALKNPLEGVFVQQLGLVYPDETVGARLVELGYERALQKQRLALNYAEWLLWQGRRGEALELFRQRMSDNYREINKWMMVFDSYDISREEVLFVLPPRVDAYLYWARFCELYRSQEDARYFYWEALAQLPQERKDVQPSWFLIVTDYFTRRGDEELALEVIRKGISVAPDYAPLHLRLGQHYFDKGITYRAKEEFDRVLVLDPGNSEALRYLRRMGYADSY